MVCGSILKLSSSEYSSGTGTVYATNEERPLTLPEKEGSATSRSAQVMQALSRSNRNESEYHKSLTVLAVVAVFAQRTQAEVSAARKLHTGATILTGIVLANGYLAGGPHIAGGAFAFPFLSLVTVRVQLVRFDLDARSAIATWTRQAGQRAAFRNAKAIQRVASMCEREQRE